MTSETSDSYPPQRIIGRKIGFTVEPPSLILVYFDHKHAKSRVRRFPLTHELLTSTQDPNIVAETIIRTYPAYWNTEVVPYNQFFYLLYELMTIVANQGAEEEGEGMGEEAVEGAVATNRSASGEYLQDISHPRAQRHEPARAGEAYDDSQDYTTTAGSSSRNNTNVNNNALSKDRYGLESSQASETSISSQSNLPDIYRSDYNVFNQQRGGAATTTAAAAEESNPRANAYAYTGAAAQNDTVEDEYENEFESIQIEDEGDGEGDNDGSNPYRAAPILAMDLNRVSPEELAKAKEAMDVEFRRRQLKPGDPGFVYDKREEFVADPNATNEWDEEE